MRITKNTTKEELVNFLSQNAQFVKDTSKDLYDRLSYASKMFKKNTEKVTVNDLATLVKEVEKLLKANAPQVVAENSVKKPLKDTSKDSKSSVVTKEKETPKKDSKKKTLKKSGAKVLNTEEESIEEATLLAEVFEEVIEVEDADGDTTQYAIAHDIKTMEDLYKAYENEEIIVFAMYWTDRHLKQFPYFNGMFKTPKGGFPLDLDLATCIYVSDAGTCAYMLSMYTEGCYVIFPDHLKEHKGVRFSNGIEFQIYRQVTTE